MTKTPKLAALALLAATAFAQAQPRRPPPCAPSATCRSTWPTRSPPHTVAACTANGYAVTATVVDRAGGVRAVQRADNAGPHTLEASRLKAYTSASAKNTTLAMMEGAQKNPAAANLVHIPGYLLLGGGVPVKVGNEVIGAVGVGGAPGGHLDEQCAMAALDKVKDLLK
jgi:uncharacterized protein GlcG (DUF336 family)